MVSAVLWCLTSVAYGLDVRVDGQLGAAATASDQGGGGAGTAWLAVGPSEAPWSIELGGREGLASGPTRVVGGIGVVGALDVGRRWTLRAGLAHHHETPWGAFMDQPVASSAGVGTGIVHRSGVEFGGALRWTLPQWEEHGFWAHTLVHAQVFPNTEGPATYLVLEQRVAVRLGRRG